MKKILTALSCFVMLVCCSFVLTACFTSVSEIKVEGFKTTYAVGEHLDLTDVKVVVCYSNGDETTVDAKPSMFSGFDTTTEGQKTLVVTYEYKSVEITYTVEPKNYSVNIALNNSSYGSLSVDNEKAEYDYGETINITVTPNAGYYLRSYSDCDCKELTRTIVVDRDLDITVNLKQGEGCNFFGYYLAVENDLNEKTMQNTEGNTSWFIKFLPNKTFTTTKLTLECQDINKFSCWVFKKENDSSYKKVCSSRLSSKTFDENELTALLGEKTGEWIDIYEYETNVGVAYSVRDKDMDLDNGCFVNVGKFRVSDFSNSNLKYLYFDNNQLKTSAFSTVSENTYTYSFSFDSTAFIQTFRIFEVDGEIWYYTNNNINEMLTKGQSRSFTQTINNVEYTITFIYSSN